MVRFFGFLVGLGFVVVAAWSLLWGVIAYVGEPPAETVEPLRPERDLGQEDQHLLPGGERGSDRRDRRQRKQQNQRRRAHLPHPVTLAD